MTTFERVKKVFAETCRLDDEVEIKIESRFTDDLDMDSLENVEVIINLEDEFGLDIPDEIGESWTTIREVVEYVDSKAAARG